MFRAAIILCAIAGQVLSAPKPCIDLLCATYHTQQTQQSSHPQQIWTETNSGVSHHHQKRDQHQDSGKIELGQNIQQSEDLSQHTGSTDDFTKKTYKEFLGDLKLGKMTQQSQNLSQQSEDIVDYTQQASGNLEFGQQLEQQTGRIHFGHTIQKIKDLLHETEPKLRVKDGRGKRSIEVEPSSAIQKISKDYSDYVTNIWNMTPMGALFELISDKVGW